MEGIKKMDPNFSVVTCDRTRDNGYKLKKIMKFNLKKILCTVKMVKKTVIAEKKWLKIQLDTVLGN